METAKVAAYFNVKIDVAVSVFGGREFASVRGNEPDVPGFDI